MRRVLPLIAALAALALPALAQAASPATVIRDCTDDEVLEGHYTQAELRAALAGLDADADEYTNCRDVIRQAQLALAGGHAPSGGGGSNGGGTTPGGTPPSGANGGGSTGSAPGAFGGFSNVPADPTAAATPTERAAIAQAVDDIAATDPVEEASAGLPTPLIGALAVGALALLVFVGLDIRRRLVDRRGA